MSNQVKSITFAVNDIKLAGQRWHNGDRWRVLCLHGWLDNSESFALLAPLLEGCDVVALDMAGHGQSDHRSKHGGYNIWDDHIDIEAVADTLGWDRFVLLGHSRGAISSFLFSTAMSECVQRLVLLDGLFPPNRELRTAPEQLRAFLTQRSRISTKQRRVYNSVEEAFASRKMLEPLSPPDALAMVARDMYPLDDAQSQWAYRHDPRLKGASVVKFTPLQHQEFLAALRVATLLIYQQGGMVDDPSLMAVLASHQSLSLYPIEGSHHFHLQRELVSAIAVKIGQWLAGSSA